MWAIVAGRLESHCSSFLTFVRVVHRGRVLTCDSPHRTEMARLEPIRDPCSLVKGRRCEYFLVIKKEKRKKKLAWLVSREKRQIRHVEFLYG